MCVKYLEAFLQKKAGTPRYIAELEELVGYGDAPIYDGSGEIKIVEGFERVKSYYVQADGATKKDYEDYAKKLVDSGYKLYYSTSANESHFATYTDGYNIVNLSYIEYYKSHDPEVLVTYINIAVDSMDKGALPPLEDNSERVTDVQVTLINATNSFFVRLENGHFLIVDGGLFEEHGRNNADLIYGQIMAQRVLEGKPTIDAWFITHPHTDHVEAFNEFSQKYGKMVDLKMLVCNFPNSEMDRIEQSNLVCDGVAQNYPDAKFIVSHAGQRFAFAGLDLDVLFTYENLYDASPNHIEKSNLSSMIFSLKMPTGRMIVMGDMYRGGCKILRLIYRDLLKCDLVQFCHHGYNGGEVKMYETMGARVGLWPNSYETVVERELYGKIEYNNIPIEIFDMHLIMSAKDEVMILRADMTKDDLLHYRKFEKK